MREKFDWFHYFARIAKENMRFEDSTLFAFIGKKRSGKSMTALAMCKLIDPDFSIEQIVFTAREFKEAAKKFRGRAILWDEASVTAYSRDFQEEVNKMINKLLQVYGYRRLAICMTLQHLNFLDKHTRSLAEVVFKCFYKWDESEKLRKYFVKPYAIITDWISEPIVKPYKVRVNSREIELGVIPIPEFDELMKIANVSRSFIREYLKKKDEFFETVGEPEQEQEERLKLDRRQLRRFPSYEKALFNLYKNLREEGRTGVEIAELCEVPVQRLYYWLKNPIYNKNLVNEALYVDEAVEAENINE